MRMRSRGGFGPTGSSFRRNANLAPAPGGHGGRSGAGAGPVRTPLSGRQGAGRDAPVKVGPCPEAQGVPPLRARPYAPRPSR